MDLQDTVVVVTGAAQGLGLEFARTLASLGAAVVLGDVQEDRVAEAAGAIQAAGGTAMALPLDITDERSNTELVQKTVTEFGRIDVLVNNAGLYTGLELEWMNIDLDEWDRVMRVNVRGLWQTSRAVVPVMRSAGRGKIVHISSITAWGGSLLHYSVSKAAVVGLTRSMAKLLGPDNITVNALAPGVVGTDALLGTLGQVPGALERRIEMQTLKRLGEPADQAGALAFLCGAGSDWMTGQVIVVDGGVVMA